jgi:hypothetical protein
MAEKIIIGPTYGEHSYNGKPVVEKAPITNLEVTKSQEKALFTALRDFLEDPSSNWNEINGKLSPERLEQIENLRAIMPKLAKDIDYKGVGENSLGLMFMGLYGMVPVESLEKIRDEMRGDYEEGDHKLRKGSITEQILKTAEYFLKRKKEEK